MSTRVSAGVFFLMVSLMIAYAAFIRGDTAAASEYVKLGGRLHYNSAVGARIGRICVIGLLVIFILSYYVETLTSLSRQIVLSDSKLESVGETLQENDARMLRLRQEYDEEYTQRAQSVAWLLQEDPTLVDDDALSTLAVRAQIRAIYVFDGAGAVRATNTVYKDFRLSKDPAEQSYAFWDVIHGYVESLVQEAQPDDSVEHKFLQYVGTRRLDAPGMVELAVSPRRLENKLQTTALPYVLNGIAVENNGYLFAVDKQDLTLTAYPKDKYVGRPAADYGLTAAALRDAYTGYQTMDSVRCLVNSLEYGDQYIYTAIPLSSIFSSRLAVALLVAGASLLVLLLIVGRLLLTFDPPAPEAEPAANGTARKEPAAARFGRRIQPAVSRWDGAEPAWAEKTPEQKLQKVVSTLIGCIALLAVVFVLNQKGGYARDSIISYILSKQWERGLNIFSISYILLACIEILVISGVIRRVIVSITQGFSARTETVGRLLDNFIKYLAILCAFFYGLNFLGIETSTLITSASILTLVIGLGAQKLIGDILAGIFIVFEGEFRVGDIVTVGDWRGTVMEIGIRTTKIRDAGNNIKIINNSAISGVVNMTKQHSYACCDVGVEYGESLERVEAILDKELPLIKERLPMVESGPFYRGVAELGDSSVVIRIIAQCAEGSRVQLTRDLNREVKLIFDRNNINIPFPQIVLNQPPDYLQATAEQKRTAKRFVREQAELSKDIVEEEDDRES